MPESHIEASLTHTANDDDTYSHCSRNVFYLFFRFKKRDLLRLLKWQKVVSKSLVLNLLKWVHILRSVIIVIYFCYLFHDLSLQCFDAVGLAAERASGLWKWWGPGVVICLERGADLHMAQLMSLPLTVSCFSKIQIGFTFLVPVHPGSPGQRALKRACVCVCVWGLKLIDIITQF